MTKRIYWSNIVTCEEQLFESLDALVAVATQHPENFHDGWHHSNELVSVEITDHLEIIYTSLDSYDENDKEVRITEVEKFEYSQSTEMATLV